MRLSLNYSTSLHYKSGGQGFCLAVVKRMTEALGGTVTFESQQGKGKVHSAFAHPQEINGKWAVKSGLVL